MGPIQTQSIFWSETEDTKESLGGAYVGEGG